jgi:hypothetical protein
MRKRARYGLGFLGENELSRDELEVLLPVYEQSLVDSFSRHDLKCPQRLTWHTSRLPNSR